MKTISLSNYDGVPGFYIKVDHQIDSTGPYATVTLYLPAEGQGARLHELYRSPTRDLLGESLAFNWGIAASGTPIGYARMKSKTYRGGMWDEVIESVESAIRSICYILNEVVHRNVRLRRDVPENQEFLFRWGGEANE